MIEASRCEWCANYPPDLAAVSAWFYRAERGSTEKRARIRNTRCVREQESRVPADVEQFLIDLLASAGQIGGSLGGAIGGGPAGRFG